MKITNTGEDINRRKIACTVDVQRKLLATGIKVHCSTISHRFQEMDLWTFMPAEKHLLTAAIRSKPLGFSNAYRP